MQIPIDVPTLIEKAKRTSGMNYGALAEDMHRSRTRVSEWLAGKAEPSSDEIAYLADKAGLPIIETIAALRPQWRHVWERAKPGI